MPLFVFETFNEGYTHVSDFPAKKVMVYSVECRWKVQENEDGFFPIIQGSEEIIACSQQCCFNTMMFPVGWLFGGKKQVVS